MSKATRIAVYVAAFLSGYLIHLATTPLDGWRAQASAVGYGLGLFVALKTRLPRGDHERGTETPETKKSKDKA